MVTKLDKELRRQVTVDDQDYTVALDVDGFRLTGKGKRKPQVALRWTDLLSGDAALAVALNASLAGKTRRAAASELERPPDRAAKRLPAKSRR